MVTNFKTIELFGPPGSGKTYCKSIIKQILIKNNYKVLNERECIFKGSKNLIKLNISKKISLKYFELLNLKNRKEKKRKYFKKIKKNIIKKSKLNYFKEIYFNICRKIVFNDKKISKFTKILEKKIKPNLNQRNDQVLFWLYELLAAQIVFKNIYRGNINHVLLLDEGLVQRSFSINNSILIKNKKKFFDFYFSSVPICKNIFYVETKQKRLFKINNIRKQDFAHKYQQKYEIKNFINFYKLYLNKQKKFQFSKIKNDKKIKLNLKSIFAHF